MSNSYRSCECEHKAHFDKAARTPNGNPSHEYFTEYHVMAMAVVTTPFGKFHVCKDCAKDCYADFSQEPTP